MNRSRAMNPGAAFRRRLLPPGTIMRLPLRALACISAVATLGCSDTLAPVPGNLVGTWVSAPSALQPQGSYRRHLLFTTGGRFAAEVRSYGVYPGQPADQLSHFSRIEGTFRRDGDRLLFDPERHIWWDRFYGANSPVHVEQPYPGGLFDDAVYELEPDRLTIRYTVYPADAPEPATAVYRRSLGGATGALR